MPRNPPSSKWAKYKTPRNARTRRGVEVTLGEEARERLDELVQRSAWGGTKSAVIEALIMSARLDGRMK